MNYYTATGALITIKLTSEGAYAYNHAGYKIEQFSLADWDMISAASWEHNGQTRIDW